MRQGETYCGGRFVGISPAGVAYRAGDFRRMVRRLGTVWRRHRKRMEGRVG